jgi:hypothetical protein
MREVRQALVNASRANRDFVARAWSVCACRPFGVDWQSSGSTLGVSHCATACSQPVRCG